MAEEPRNPVPNQPPSEVADARPALDEASASLADALRTSFNVLTFIIIVLLGVFVAKGFFTVQSDRKAIVLRFGAYEEGNVKDQGLHFAWPYPIEQVAYVWVRPRKLEVNTFWPRVTEQEKNAKMEQGAEIPKQLKGAEDAVMITGDLNVLQAQWDVTYRVRQDNKAIVDYYRTLWEEKPGEGKPLPAAEEEAFSKEDQLVRDALQSAAIQETAAMKVFDIYPRNKEVLIEHVKKSLDETLRQLDCGLEVDLVTLRELRPPRQVIGAFNEVLAATQQMAELRVAAERDAQKTLIETAGDVGVDLGKNLESWWAAKDAGDAEKTQEIESQMSETFQKAGGQVRNILREAQAYRVQVVESAKADRSVVESLLKNPAGIQVFLDHARVDALQEVLSACYEKYYYNSASAAANRLLEIWLNRKPELIRAATKPVEVAR